MSYPTRDIDTKFATTNESLDVLVAMSRVYQFSHMLIMRIALPEKKRLAGRRNYFRRVRDFWGRRKRVKVLARMSLRKMMIANQQQIEDEQLRLSKWSLCLRAVKSACDKAFADGAARSILACVIMILVFTVLALVLSLPPASPKNSASVTVVQCEKSYSVEEWLHRIVRGPRVYRGNSDYPFKNIPRLLVAELTKEEWDHSESIRGKIEHLHLDYFKIKNEEIRSMSVNLCNLKELSLNDTNVDDEGVKHISSMNKLHTLYLAYTAVTDSGVAELETMSHLRRLDLTGTKITDKALSAISKLNTLEHLALSGTQVTEKALISFALAMPKLKTLDLGGCSNLDEDAIDRIQDQSRRNDLKVIY